MHFYTEKYALKNWSMGTIQIAIQAWKADTSSAGAGEAPVKNVSNHRPERPTQVGKLHLFCSVGPPGL